MDDDLYATATEQRWVKVEPLPDNNGDSKNGAHAVVAAVLVVVLVVAAVAFIIAALWYFKMQRRSKTVFSEESDTLMPIEDNSMMS